MTDRVYNDAFFHYNKVSHRLLADDKGEPLTVYHGTAKRFESFSPLSHFGSIYAAKRRIKDSSETKSFACSFFESAGSMDKNIGIMIEVLIKSFDKGKPKHASEPICIPVHLALHNPKLMIEMGFYRTGYKDDLLYRFIFNDIAHKLKFYRHVHTSKKRNKVLCKVLNDLKVPVMYDFIFFDPFKMREEEVTKELSLENLYPVLGSLDKNPYQEDLNELDIQHQLANNSYINRLNLSMQRMIRYWEAQGYDGFIYKNTVGDCGAFSYVVFRPQQVIRLDRPMEYQLSPLYPSEKNQEQLNEIMRKRLSLLSPRLITKKESSRMSAWHLESSRFYSNER